ncbi:MAG TPA: serine/threonine-protein kinase [Verrucomicrobiae bacterium]|jgi:serine/threonine protein kinase
MNDTPNQDVILFTEALRLQATERANYLDQACLGNAALRARVEALLKAYENAGDFLAEPPSGVPITDTTLIVVGEKSGDRIGHYKLLQQIGEGGCGVVFMAEQLEPVRRRVALKIVKPGLDTKNVIARFEAERQALALMDHPNIAQIFDAGATDSGRPYFVMELVRGVKITEYCDQNSLTTRERLDLFKQVCGAVQHAHQKGIIHRDLKPSNILVTTTTDGKALPKVIDFGIAKATTGQPLTDKTLFTAFEMLIGTPDYMSPEQATLTSVDVDTRSDIYSLGVLLYELLTGTTPFNTTELLKAGLDEVRRVIREQEPIRPSTRLSTMIELDLATVSRHRGSEAPKIIRDVRGDLDWIVLKAMEKDRTRRYPTANDLATDVEHYLHGEIILARPPGWLYKTRKLVTRNKLLFSGLGIIFFLLAAALGIMGRLWVVERQARENVQHQEEVYRLESLGVAQLTQQKLPEAESSFRHAFDLRHQFMQDQPPNAMVFATFMMVLHNENKDAERWAFIKEFLNPSLLSQPGYHSLFTDVIADQMQDFAEKGQWPKAVPLATQLVEHEPNQSSRYHALAPLLVATHDLAGYQKLCAQIVVRFKDTQDPYTADQMAKDCLILPDSHADLKVIGKLADVAVTQGRKSSSYPFFVCCKALAEYRQGHFSEVKKWASVAANEPFPFSQTEAFAILAMAQFQSGQTNEARLALTNCERVIQEKLPKLSSENIGQDWRDWIVAHSLHDEAKDLIEGNAGAAGNSSQK